MYTAHFSGCLSSTCHIPPATRAPLAMHTPPPPLATLPPATHPLPYMLPYHTPCHAYPTPPYMPPANPAMHLPLRPPVDRRNDTR